VFFYVDESGNTGLNLFDGSQPNLLYGLLSSKVNLDALAEPHLQRLRRRFGVSRLHATELGIGRLSAAAPTLLDLVRKHDIRFALYKLVKLDYAIIQFFDQVFDQGLNPAVGWATYWTPLRYVMLLKVAHLFDEELAKKAWAARTEKKDEESSKILLEVCRTLLERVSILPDERSRQLIRDTLEWASTNPERIEYNANSKNMQLAISPNLIGFQFVLFGVAQRLRSGRTSMRGLYVDRQHQFNGAQAELAGYYARAAGQVLPLGPGLPELDLRGMPTNGLTFGSSEESAGLEIVDLFLWIFKRLQECAADPALFELIRFLMKRGLHDELSLRAISARWEPFFSKIQEHPLTAEDLERARLIMSQHEEQRVKVVAVR
jgi:hypothetical protein